MAIRRTAPVAFACFLITAYAALLIVIFSFLGGLLNRGRGGWIDFGGSSNTTQSVNISNRHDALSYWPAHLCKNLLFAVPTGIAVVSAGSLTFPLVVF